MSKLDSTIRRLLRDPDRRRAWIKYQVQLQGRSMASVAAEAGVKRSSLYSAFLKPYPRMEKVIADAVGLSPQDLFPERYDDAGLPNRRMGRPYKSATKSAKNTTRTAARNINNRKVA